MSTLVNWVIDTLGDGQVPEVTEGTRYPANMANFSTAHCKL